MIKTYYYHEGHEDNEEKQCNDNQFTISIGNQHF